MRCCGRIVLLAALGLASWQPAWSAAAAVMALADVDGDGDLDAVMTTSRDRARLLLASGAVGSWIELDLRQKGPNPFAIGAWVTIRSGSRT